MARRDYPDNSFRLSEQPTDDPLSKNCIIVNCQIVNWNYESEVHQVTEQQPAQCEQKYINAITLLKDIVFEETHDNAMNVEPEEGENTGGGSNTNGSNGTNTGGTNTGGGGNDNGGDGDGD